MMKYFKRGRPLLSLALAMVMLTVWMAPSSLLTVHAAVEDLVVNYRFDAAASAHELYWRADVQPGSVRYTWHDASGVEQTRLQTAPDATGAPNPEYRWVIENNVRRVVLRLPFVRDHVHDVTVKVYANSNETNQTGEGKVHVLTGMTFEGESFDQSANVLVDLSPLLLDMNGNPAPSGDASRVVSGQEPKMRLRWKVPTIWTAGGLRYLTEDAATTWGASIQKSGGQTVESAGFYFTMNKGRNTTVPLGYQTYWNGSNLVLGGATVGSSPPQVQGLNAFGVPADGYVYVDLQKQHGIEPGTEYQNMKMGVSLTTTGGVPLLFLGTNMQVGQANAFPVVNTDVAFAEYGPLTSVFTPMEYEITKVDVDKVQVKFRKVTNGIYTQLYYEIQDLSGNDLNFPNAPEVRGNWITVPDSSLPSGTLYGSVIVPFTVVNGELPNRFIRVVSAEQGALLPRNTSMVNSLTLMGSQTGRPALPQNLTVEARYDGLQTVNAGGTLVEIPTSRLVVTFDKPDIWLQYSGAAWDAHAADPLYADTDPVYNLLLSSLLPDLAEGEITDRTMTLSDATNSVTVQVPVRQKRTLVIGKGQLSEVPGNPNRLTAELDGTLLFHDFVTETTIGGENNEVGTRGPYPVFLLPNTRYYLQVFTARKGDLAAINTAIWADRGFGGNGLPSELREVISYTSPVVSFTTYPMKEVPVPLPTLVLSVAPAVSVPDPATGKMQLEGINVSYDHILRETDWRRYISTDQWNLYNTRATTNDTVDGPRRVELFVEYRFYITRQLPVGQEVFRDTGVEIIEYPFTADPPVWQITQVPLSGGGFEAILPNTVYHVKARPFLRVRERIVNELGVVEESNTYLGNTVDTAVKSITTPKLDLVSLDNVTRNPRAPTEFSVASAPDGTPMLTDASVVMQWMHRERDVGYELMVTSVVPQAEANPDQYENDPVLIDFLASYRERTPNLVGINGHSVWIPLYDAAARADMQSGLGLVLNADTLVVLFPMDGFLEPNTQYYFSLRAIRDRGEEDSDGNQNPPPSRWVTVPVTTPMVMAPQGLEVVRDIEIGFTVEYAGTRGDPANFELYLKRSTENDSAYGKLSRDRYSVVRDGTTYHWRVYGLSSDTWYDVRLRHIPPDARWYDAASATPALAWKATPGTPITLKTRDALREIEVRWIGDAAYEYYLEMRAAHETNYVQLLYAQTGVTDYGYEDKAGNRMQHYQDRTNAQVAEGPVKHMLYARITRKRTMQRDGTVLQVPLATNTSYHVRLWARNPMVDVVDAGSQLKADSIRVGPVTTRTDFSQIDYDLDKDKENIIAMYDEQSEHLSRKPYWVIDKGAKQAVRVLLKGDRVQAMIESNPGITQTINLEVEHADASLYEVTIPEQVLAALHRTDGRLTIQVAGAEYMLSRNSLNLPALKAQVASSQVKETMVRMRIERTDLNPSVLPALYTPLSKQFALSMEVIGSRYDKGHLDTVIHDILNNPKATGPFRYGLLDRERDALDRSTANLVWRVHTDLFDTVGGLVARVETEMSRYLKDMLDGGSGVAGITIQKAAITAFPGAVLVRHQYEHGAGRILPMIRAAGTTAWKEPAGLRAFTDAQVAFRLEGPASTVVASARSQETTSPVSWPGLSAISARYDLSHAFGNRPVYPGNTVSGQEAVLLFELLSEQTREMQGLTMAQKLERMSLGDVIQTRTLLTPIDNQRAVSWSVYLYSQGARRPLEELKPARTPMISNLGDILPKLQNPVILGIDMGLSTLDMQRRFDATTVSDVGTMLEMANQVLKLLGR